MMERRRFPNSRKESLLAGYDHFDRGKAMSRPCRFYSFSVSHGKLSLGRSWRLFFSKSFSLDYRAAQMLTSK